MFRLRARVAAWIGVGLLAIGPAAWADDRLVGAWEATLKPPIGGPIRVILRVEAGEGEVLKAFLDSPDQDAYDFAVDEVEAAAEGKVAFRSKALRARFEGTLNEAGDAIAGKWTQGVPLDTTFRRIDAAAVPRPKSIEVPDALEGLWEGTLKVQAGIELRLVLDVHRGEDGRLKAYLDSPDQGADDLPISSLTLEDGTLKFGMKAMRAEFEGTRSEDGAAFEGTFTQVGRKFPLALRRVGEVTKPKRPQMPEPPFPYKAEDVSYENAAAGVKLAGTLTIPEGAGPFPAVLLITGSGSQDRDETLLGHKPFLVLADYLTRRGIAVLRVDDRGVGGSTGDAAAATSEDFAGDVLAGVAYLKTRPEIDAGKIGLCGHSEGGLIAPIAASRSGDVAFIVLMAGTGVPGTDILRLQSRKIAEALGAGEAALAAQAEMLEKTFALIEEHADADAARTALAAMTKEFTAKLTDTQREELQLDENEAEGSAALSAATESMIGPWFRYFLKYDPRPTLAKVRCPVLAINGAKDLQVIPSQNLPEIEKALKAGGNERVTIRELPGLNHLFQACETGSPAEYAKIEETINPAALEAIGDWIVETVGR
jgi:pimeloyl-ACP methyl ester carboxylesterase